MSLITSELNSSIYGTKKYSRKRKLNEKNSCTPINPPKIFKPCPKKIHTRNLITKQNSCGSKIPHPHHNFSSGPSLMASYSKRMVNLLIIMYICHDPFTFSCNRKSEQQESLKRDFLHHTGSQKNSLCLASVKFFWQEDFRSTANFQYMKNEILIITRDLRNYGGVWEAIVNKTVCGHGLCVFQQRFAMHWTLALFLASVFCSLYCWATVKFRK